MLSKLNAEQIRMGRRNFLKAAATLPAVGAIAYQAHNVGPVNTGIVGTGLEGRILIGSCDPKYIYLTASCDIRPDNRILGHEMMKDPKLGHHPNPKLYENYEEMLNNPEIEAVILAVPLHLHAPFAVQALNAGKHVFVEKSMAYSLEQCQEMIRIAKQKNCKLQIGHQRFYNPLYWDAYKMMKENLLGDVYHIRALWHRNTDWNYWTHVWDQARPEMQQQLRSMNTQKYGYPDVQHLVNWRWYQEMSHGLWTELCSHQIAVANWFFESPPTAVYAAGGTFKTEANQNELYRKFAEEFRTKQKYRDTEAKTLEDYMMQKRFYPKDDRTIADHIYAIFEYPHNRILTYSSIQSSSVDEYYEEIMGTRGSIIFSNENETYLFWEPGWDEAKAQKANEEKKNTQITVANESAGDSAFAVHVSEKASGGGGAGEMSPLLPYRLELQAFAHSIRTNTPILCDGVQGAKAAVACFYGEKSLLAQQRLEIPTDVLA